MFTCKNHPMSGILRHGHRKSNYKEQAIMTSTILWRNPETRECNIDWRR